MWKGLAAPYHVGDQVNLCQSSVSIETQILINRVYDPFFQMHVPED